MLEYSSIAELCRAAEQAGSTISQTALADQAEQMEQPADVLYQRMADSLGVMRDAVRAGMDPELRSTSGLTGGDAAKMARYAERGGITGTFLNRAVARAIAERFTLSEHTVKTHLRHAYAKMDVHSRQELLDLIEETSAAKKS